MSEKKLSKPQATLAYIMSIAPKEILEKLRDGPGVNEQERAAMQEIIDMRFPSAGLFDTQEEAEKYVQDHMHIYDITSKNAFLEIMKDKGGILGKNMVDAIRKVYDKKFPSVEIHETNPPGSNGIKFDTVIVDDVTEEIYDPKLDDSDKSDELRESREYHPDRE